MSSLLLLLLSQVGSAPSGVNAKIHFSTPPQVQSGFESCQDPPVQQGFDVTKYLGVWYEITKLPFVEEEGGCCITANYTLKSDGHVKVDNRLHHGGINGSLQQAVGDAHAPDPSVPAKLAVTFGAPIEAPYWVLSTDYSSYALVFSCTNLVVYRFEYAWILSRTPIMDPALKQRLLARFRTFGVDTSAFVDTMQEGCKYY